MPFAFTALVLTNLPLLYQQVFSGELLGSWQLTGHECPYIRVLCGHFSQWSECSHGQLVWPLDVFSSASKLYGKKILFVAKCSILSFIKAYEFFYSFGKFRSKSVSEANLSSLSQMFGSVSPRHSLRWRLNVWSVLTLCLSITMLGVGYFLEENILFLRKPYSHWMTKALEAMKLVRDVITWEPGGASPPQASTTYFQCDIRQVP